MQNISFLHIITYVSYLFIITVYAWRTIKYVRMPIHLRWDLYPLPGDKANGYGGSYLELLEWWKKPQPNGLLQKVLFMVKDYISFIQYYRQNRGYWFVLYPLHIGFYLVFISHVFYFFGGLAEVRGLSISAFSTVIVGKSLYYLTLIAGVGGCIFGIIGCMGLLIKRSINRDLRLYSSPMYYFNYIFFFAVFFSGLYAWYLFDPTFSTFREFWKSLISFQAVNMDMASAVHIVLFSLFLIYMPFTRAMHYITKFFTFFSVRWDDNPNFKGSKTEMRLQNSFNNAISWAAPHVRSGVKWSDVVSVAENANENGQDR